MTEDFSFDQLEDFMSKVLNLVDKTRIIIQEANTRPRNFKLKRNMDEPTSSVVTDTDRSVENMLVKGLKREYPDHNFISEEKNCIEGIQSYSEKPTWIIDPLDGTMNFVHQNPMIATSIAFAAKRRILMSIVDCPLIRRRYTAIKGKGAFLNGVPIKTSNVHSLKDAMVIMELPTSGGHEKRRMAVENVASLLTKAHSIRSPGSMSLNMAWVSSASSDAFFHSGLHCWDMAAGALLVKEAGGFIMSPNGDDFDLMSGWCLVAATKELAEELCSSIHCTKPHRDFADICPI